MIKYLLKCNSCASEFDSWFSTSNEYNRLKKLKLLNCNICGSDKIEKSLMSPNLANVKKNNETEKNLNSKELKKKLKEYQKFVKKNFEFVGDNFAYEARSIHYNKIKTKKAIYGNASLEDVKELNDEGIETEMMPWIEDKDN
tara:strand:- start:1937 stop:2362 length:426 start_codon:yes stop_codon:yes gene_type:complete